MAERSSPPRRGLTWDDFFSARARRQLGFFAAGASFFLLSTAITRRAMVRRYKASVPRFYQQSNQPNTNINGALEAVEALNIATVNVLSVTLMAAGGLLWAFDISSLPELRQRLRGGLGFDAPPGQSSAEEEMEEWLATVLARKEQKEQIKRKTEAEDTGHRR